MKNKKLAVYVLVALIAIMSAITIFYVKSNQKEVVRYSIEFNHPKKVVGTSDVNITCVGDVLLHGRLYQQAFDDGEYDFRPNFENVSDIFAYSELSIANVESLPAGLEYGSLSSYPYFNSPKAIIPSLIDSNFNAFTFANNHVLDKGEKGYNIVLDDMKGYDDIIQVGLNESYEDQRRIRYYQQGDMKIAVLAYTTLTNGIKPPGGKDYLVNYSVYQGNWYKNRDGYMLEDDLKQDIKTARDNADLVVVVYHHGTYGENTDVVHPYEIEHTEWFLEQGVDVMFGGGAHVIQPVDILTSSSGHTMYTTYSLANFVAAQSSIGFKFTIGIIGGIEAQKISYLDGSSDTRLYNPYLIPTFIDDEYHVQAWGEDFDVQGSEYKEWTEEILTRYNDEFTIYTKDEYLDYFETK